MNELTGLNVLKGAYSLLQEGKSHWAQKDLFRTEHGQVLEHYEAGQASCYCALGAMAKFLDKNNIVFGMRDTSNPEMPFVYVPVFKKAVQMLAFGIKGETESFLDAYVTVYQWNDGLKMTYPQVVQGFKKTIQYFEKQNEI